VRKSTGVSKGLRSASMAQADELDSFLAHGQKEEGSPAAECSMSNAY